VSARPRWRAASWAAIGLGLLTAAWLPFEDAGPLGALLLALAWCAWAAGRDLYRHPPEGGRFWRRALGAGFLAGLVVTPLAFLLLAIKTGLHAHAAPDYTPAHMDALLLLTPLWIVGGLLLGGAAAVWRQSTTPE
jgi:hypothetical protein